MNKILNNIIAFFVTAALITACTKVEDLPTYSAGTSPTLSASRTAVTTAPADSNNVAIAFNWTNPNFATDSANYKYIIEIDSAGRNFSKAWSRTVIKNLTTSFAGKEFNNVLLGFGFAFNISYPVEIRVIASYLNNNDRKVSNVVRINATPYKVPPKVALPASGELYVVGDAFSVLNFPSWDNPGGVAPWPGFRRLWQKDETTWEGIYKMKASGSYLLLPQFGGVWTNKINVANGSLPGLANGGDFGRELGNDNIPGNVAGDSGWHKLSFNFQVGRFSVTRITTANYMLPQNLWVTGDGVSGWSNTPPNSQQFTALRNGVFQLDIVLNPAKAIKFLSNQGQWQPQFGGTAGNLGAAYVAGPEPDAIATPAANGDNRYRITVNFHTMSYTLVKL